MGTNVGYGSSVYRPVERVGVRSSVSSSGKWLRELKFHGPFLGIVLAIIGTIHFLK
jgi:hypothetical protein